MILEGIVTTKNPDGGINIAPMGPIVDSAMSNLHFRPFKTSRTYANLKARPEGVFHVVDDVLLLAKAAINRFDETPEIFSATKMEGHVLADACRWYEFRIHTFDDNDERTNLHATVIHIGKLRDFFGFNRAKHAVLEAAILATRVQILPAEEIIAGMSSLDVIVQKTAGPREQQAFDLLGKFIEDALNSAE